MQYVLLLNVYMALSMLAETTDGDSREQILELLGMEEIQDLRELTKAVWEQNYSNNDSICILANSLWLDTETAYKKETVDLHAVIIMLPHFRERWEARNIIRSFKAG